MGIINSTNIAYYHVIGNVVMVSGTFTYTLTATSGLISIDFTFYGTAYPTPNTPLIFGSMNMVTTSPSPTFFGGTIVSSGVNDGGVNYFVYRLVGTTTGSPIMGTAAYNYTYTIA